MADKHDDGNDKARRALDERIDKLEQWLLSDDGGANEETAAVGSSALDAEPYDVPDRNGARPHTFGVGAKKPAVTHVGHRQRMRRTAASGLESMSDIQLVELLLSYVVPRKDTNPLAHLLLDKFGNVSDIIHASAEELVSVSGMTTNAAILLTMLGKIYVWNGVRDIALSDPTDAADFFDSIFVGGGINDTCVAYLDPHYGLIVVETFDGAFAPPINSVIGSACKHNASAILIARRESVDFPDAFSLTEYIDRLKEVLGVINVALLDFMVFTDYGYYTACVPKSTGEWQAKYVFIPSRSYSRSPELLDIVRKKKDR